MKQRTTYFSKDNQLAIIHFTKELPKRYWSEIAKLPFEDRKDYPKNKTYIIDVKIDMRQSDYWEIKDINKAVEKYTEITKSYLNNGWKNATPNLPSYK